MSGVEITSKNEIIIRIVKISTGRIVINVLNECVTIMGWSISTSDYEVLIPATLTAIVQVSKSSSGSREY